MPPAICPICGEPVPPDAKACPGCGADEDSGWSEEAWRGGSEIPEDDFNYEEFVRREFQGGSPARPPLHWFWWVVAVVLLAVLFSWWIL